MRIATLRVGDPRVIGRLALDVSLDETKEHRGLDPGEFGVMPAIPALVRVLVQVEELSVVTSAIDRDLVPVSDERPERECRRLVPILGDRPVTRRPLASPRPELRDPLHASRNRLTGRLEEARGEVDETLQVGRDAALRNLTRPAHEERQSQEILVVERALVEETVLAKEMAVVGAEHDDRVVG